MSALRPTAREGITSRQAEILKIMATRQAAGTPVTLRELGAACGYGPSANGPSNAITSLEKKGFVARRRFTYKGSRVIRLPGSDDDDLIVETDNFHVTIWDLQHTRARPVFSLKLDEAVRLSIALQNAIFEMTNEKHPGAEDLPQGAEAGSRLPDNSAAQ